MYIIQYTYYTLCIYFETHARSFENFFEVLLYLTSIDNIWTNITDRHILSNVLNCSISNHFPITCVIPLTTIEYTDNGLLHNITNHNISPDTLNQFNIKYMGVSVEHSRV